MKKILFATTALVATAGFAAAEVQGTGPGNINITGVAEIGIFDNGNDNTQFFTDIDITFNMTGEADNGLTFGASVDLDEGGAGAPAHANDSAAGGATMFVAFGGARLTMGDTDGALDNVVPEMALAAGSIADDHTAHGAYISHNNIGRGSLDGFTVTNPNQIARFDYTFNAFTFSLSAEQDFDGADSRFDVDGDGVLEDVGDTIWGAGVRYSGDFAGTSITAGLGYQTQDNLVDVWALGVTAGFANGLSVGANYTEIDPTGANNTISAWNVGVGYTMNALALSANFGEIDPDGANNNVFGWGLAASYDMGGGLQAQLGYGHTDPDGPNNDVDTWSLGLRMDF